MNVGHEQFDDSASEQQLEQILTSTFAAPPMTADFVNRLSRELDQEFELAAYYSERSYPNGAAKNGAESSEAAIIAFAQGNPAAIKTYRRSGLRILATAVAAAGLLLSVGLWSGRPAYGWAAMVEALEKCEWVQAITRNSGDIAGKNAAIGWFSQSKQIAAREMGESRVYLNFHKQTVENFDPARRVVEQTVLIKAPEHVSNELLAMLLATENLPTTLANSATGFRIADFELIEESWNETKQPQEIELKVVLRNKAVSRQEPVRLAFLVNKETHLPMAGRVIAGKAPTVKSVEFSYPQHGPESIFALGVPQETPVVTVKSSVNVPPGEVLAGVEQSSRASVSDKVTAENIEVEKLIVAKGSQIDVQTPTAQPTAVTVQPTVDDNSKSQGVDDRIASIPPAEKHSVENKAPAPLPDALDDGKLVERLNSLLAEFWLSQGISPSQPASDTEFLRRVYLDLTGRIPTVSEVYAFLDDPNHDRREQLVNDLLSRRDHATHLAAVWRTILLPEGVSLETYGGTNKFDSWLADRFGQNLPYDEIVRQLLLAEGRVSESGPLLFYAALKLNPEEIAAKTSRVFLGTRMECAQCHDHPFDDRIAQTDFWGFAAHFAQISRPQGKMEMTSPVLRVADNDFGEVMIPDTNEVVLPRLPNVSTTDPTGMEPSRRQQLVDWLTTRNNDEFSRAAVNRVWQQVFGRGLIEPVDDMRPDNKPVCPEVLDLLAKDFAASGFNLRRLLRALVLTDAYQLSSGTATDEPSQALCFARMNMKNFTADQLYDCIAVATLNESLARNSHDGALARTNNSSRAAFIEQFRSAVGDRTAYQAGVPQALTLMHGAVVHGATDLESSGLLKSLNAPFFTDEQRLNTLFLATLSREPEDLEREKLLSYMGGAKDAETRLGILGDVLWALLNSAEFTFIH